MAIPIQNVHILDHDNVFVPHASTLNHSQCFCIGIVQKQNKTHSGHFSEAENFQILPKSGLFFWVKKVGTMLDSNEILPKIFTHVFIQECWWRS